MYSTPEEFCDLDLKQFSDHKDEVSIQIIFSNQYNNILFISITKQVDIFQ